MKIARGICIWVPLALCGLLVLAAMAWLTRETLAAEKNRAYAESRADLEERTRLALWRMDAAGAALVLGENNHPPGDYAASISGDEPMVKLHFELRQFGSLTSPEADRRPTDFQHLRGLLNQNPLPGDEWSVLTCAAEEGESAWLAVPKSALKPQLDNALIRRTKGGAGSRADQAYQMNFAGVEQAQRAKTVEGTIQLPAATPGITELGPMRAVRLGGELFLLRQLTASLPGGSERRVQGVWLDPSELAEHLLGQVGDLLPRAALVPLPAPAADDPLSLVSFPFHLQRNEIPLAGTPELTRPLIAGWLAVSLALAATALLIHGVMRLSERRASFVSAVTHELRSPLTTFRLYSEMLESGAVPPEKRKTYLRVLSREADRLSHLVENVLSFSKVERGNARSAVRDTTTGQLLDGMRDRLEARLATAGLALKMDSAGEIPIRTDAAAVEHILFNLIDNAAKYAAGSEPAVVEITARPAGKWLEIFVADHGPGIPAGERRRIFRAFHKSAREAAESRPGVGLGLALSRRLARSLGGTLKWADSAGGACFALRLPAS